MPLIFNKPMKKINILTLIFFLSCTTQKDFINNSSTHSLIVSDNFLLPLDSLSGIYIPSLQLVENHDGQFLFINDTKCRCINVYDLNSKKLVDKIWMANDGPNRIVGNAVSMYVHAMDSIFIKSTTVPKLFLINNFGHIVNTFNLPGVSQSEIKGYNSFPLGITSAPMFFRNGALHMNTYNIDNVKDHSEIFTCVKLNLDTSESEYIYPRPAFYNSGNWGFSSLLARHCLIYNSQEDLLVTSHGNFHNLIIRDSNDNERTVFAGSSFVGDIKPISKNMSLFISENEARQHESNIGYYTSIIYDKYREVYYRFATLPIPESKRDQYTIGDLKSIIILDKDFNKMGEHIIPGDYDFSIRFINKDGLNIFSKAKYHDNNEDNLIFDVFTLIKNN
jgi:hypothetical protein